MEFRVLKYFLAVAREQNISAAAESLHLSQPTLSMQLKALEEELGKQLLIRGTKGSRKVTLTEEGMILRNRAEEILALVNKTEHEIQLSDEFVAGDVYIGAGETDTVRLFARAARRLNTRYPDIHFHISSGNAAYVLEHLERGLIDFGLIYGPVDRTKYESLEVPGQDTFGVLMRTDSPLASRQSISPADLWDKPLIVSSQEERDGWPILTWLKRDISKLHIAATYTLLYNGSLLVSEGLGYAICLDKLINTAESNLCFRPLSPALNVSANIIWKRYQIFPKAAEKYLEELQKIFQEESRPE